MRVGDIASAIGKGLFAGAVGTAAMTVSTIIEQRIRMREGSSAPVEAAEKILPIEVDDDEEAKVNSAIHWAYGTAWGGPRGILATLGLPLPAATAAHFATVWGSALVALPKLRVAPPVREWGAKEIAVDAWHHAVYAISAGVAYGWLDRRSRARTERRRGPLGRARDRAAAIAA